jgi:hypothetical protein
MDELSREIPIAEIARAHREQQAEREAVNWLLAQMAEDLPCESATYKALARHDSWRVVLQMAQWEGFFEVASLLEEAAQTLGTGALEEKSGMRNMNA